MQKDKQKLILSMLIFGTIGLVRRYIPYSSAVTACARGIIGSVFLLCVCALQKKKIRFSAMKGSVLPLLISGSLLGLNWIMLFEAYRYTSVSIATISYYMAPVIVVVLSPFLLHEKLTVKKGICAAVTVFGMVLVSGAGQSEIYGLRGIVYGLAAAMMYAAVVLINRLVKGPDAMERTVLQLMISAAALLPYVLLTEDFTAFSFEPVGAAMLVTAGIVHTGIAYSLYFDAVRTVPAQATAMFSYLDPVTAVLISAFVLAEPMTWITALGAVLVLAGAFLSEVTGS